MTRAGAGATTTRGIDLAGAGAAGSAAGEIAAAPAARMGSGRRHARLRVLHVCTDFFPATGGIEQFVLELASRSADAGLDVSVVCHDRTRRPSVGKGEPLPSHDLVRGVRVRRVPFLDLKYYKPTRLPLDALSAADVIHVHGIGAPLDLAAILEPLHERPIVVSTHGGIFHTTSLGTIKRLYFRYVVPAIARRVWRFIASSKSDLHLFASTLPPAKLQLIENGVRLPRPSAGVRKEHATCLHVGRLAETKRVDLLLRAFANLHRRGVPFRLRLVGPDWGGQRDSLQILAGSLGIGGSVDFLGEVDRATLDDEYARAAVFVSASRYEGFGLALVEAMSCGCVPVVSRIPAFEDLIEPGRTGHLVDYKDADATADVLAAALARAAASDSTGVAAAASRDAQWFSWDRKMLEFLDVYEAAVAAAAG